MKDDVPRSDIHLQDMQEAWAPDIQQYAAKGYYERG